MMLPSEGRLLQIFPGESDRHEGIPLPAIDAAIPEGLATLEKVQIRFYRSGGRSSGTSPR